MMPLDDFQKEIVAVIRQNRDALSPFAGGTVIQRHGFRLSDDHDIFTAEDPDPIMRIDARALRAAGFKVQITKSYDGFRECRIVKSGTGTATLQWTQGLSREYFAPVPDPEFGHRLHFADLAANKALAAASRMAKRDFADLWMLDRHVMPLWRIVCAASGKFPQESPFALVERIAYNLITALRQDRKPLLLACDLSDSDLNHGLASSITKARSLLPDLAVANLGRLQVDSRNRPVRAPDHVPGGRWIAPKTGGGLPSFAGIDSEMVEALTAEYGQDGLG